jgi:hypothetical protein
LRFRSFGQLPGRLRRQRPEPAPLVLEPALEAAAAVGHEEPRHQVPAIQLQRLLLLTGAQGRNEGRHVTPAAFGPDPDFLIPNSFKDILSQIAPQDIERLPHRLAG